MGIEDLPVRDASCVSVSAGVCHQFTSMATAAAAGSRRFGWFLVRAAQSLSRGAVVIVYPLLYLKVNYSLLIIGLNSMAWRRGAFPIYNSRLKRVQLPRSVSGESPFLNEASSVEFRGGGKKGGNVHGLSRHIFQVAGLTTAKAYFWLGSVECSPFFPSRAE